MQTRCSVKIPPSIFKTHFVLFKLYLRFTKSLKF